MLLRELLECSAGNVDYLQISTGPRKEANIVYECDLIDSEAPEEWQRLTIDSWEVYVKLERKAECELMIVYYLFVTI